MRSDSSSAVMGRRYAWAANACTKLVAQPVWASAVVPVQGAIVVATIGSIWLVASLGHAVHVVKHRRVDAQGRVTEGPVRRLTRRETQDGRTGQIQQRLHGVAPLLGGQPPQPPRNHAQRRARGGAAAPVRRCGRSGVAAAMRIPPVPASRSAPPLPAVAGRLWPPAPPTPDWPRDPPPWHPAVNKPAAARTPAATTYALICLPTAG